MNFNIRMGIPEMINLWNELQQKHRAGTIKKRKSSYIRNGEMHLRSYQKIHFIQDCKLMKSARYQNDMV